MNTLEKKKQTLAAVKMAIAEKYIRLAKSINSKPRRANYLRHAAKFRRQAEEIARPLARIG